MLQEAPASSFLPRRMIDVRGHRPPVGSERTLVIANRDEPGSRTVAERYRRLRKKARLLELPLGRPGLRHLSSPQEYVERVADPLRRFLSAQGGWMPDYLVLSRDLPLGVPQPGGGFASIDSVLATAPGRERGPGPLPAPDARVGRMALNPYYAAGGGPFSRARFGMFLVGRLEAPTLEGTLALIERSHLARPFADPFLLRPSAHGEAEFVAYNAGMREASRRLGPGRAVVQRITPDWGRNPPGREGHYMGLCTWAYGYGPAYGKDYLAELPRFVFRPGAVGYTVDSYAARLESWRDPRHPGQPPVSGMLGSKAGLTVASGTIDEPFLAGACCPLPLVTRYAEGHTAGEAFWGAIPFLSWRNVVVGDPLCAAFASSPGEAA